MEKSGRRGRLEPGATYIYERDGKKIYARKQGAHPGDRILIGYDYDGSGQNVNQGLEQFAEDVLWAEIRAEAQHNPAVQEALEHVKLIYELTRSHEPKPGWHPV